MSILALDVLERESSCTEGGGCCVETRLEKWVLTAMFLLLNLEFQSGLAGVGFLVMGC